MDRKVLKATMQNRFEETWEAALKAVETAPDGQWIAGSEWQVQEAFQKLTTDCFREMVQFRIGTLPSEHQAAFSPSGKSRTGAARQRRAKGPRADHRR
jgi:hypothetical protein